MSQEQERIEVLYALADKSGKYSKYAGTSICSLFENTNSKVRVHIFQDGSIKGENKKNFEILAQRYNQEIIFYNVRELQKKVLKKAEEIMEKAMKDDRYTEAALYRLLAPQILPEDIERLIYLDSDTIINIDIKKLWKEKVGTCGIGAVFEEDILRHYKVSSRIEDEEVKKLVSYFESLGVKLKETFNSGVLLMDLKILRKRGDILLSGLRVMADSNSDNNFYDQNILNFFFANSAYHLPWNYNMLQHWDRQFRSSRTLVGIYHYMGHTLRMNLEDLRDTIFYDYFAKSPWMNGKIICYMFDELEKRYLRYMEKRFSYMRMIVSSLAKKKLVLAFSTRYEKKVYELLQDPDKFNLKATYPNEIKLPTYIVNVNDKNKTENDVKKRDVKRPAFSDDVTYFYLGDDNKLNLNLPYDVDEYYYLFFVEDFIKVRVMLEEAGLEAWGHYMDGNFLLEDIIEGGVMNPNKFVDML